MTPEQRRAFIGWAEGEAAAVVNSDASTEEGKGNRHRIAAGFDVVRTIFPDDEDWMGEVWVGLMK
jgi:hypothetical protein